MNLRESTVLASLLTPRGRGAVATIGVRGELSRLNGLFTAANGGAAERQEVGRLCFGTWASRRSGTAAAREEVVFVRTGHSAAEVHCHGGSAAVDRILDDLGASGGKILDTASFNSEGLSPVEVECRQALIRTTTRRTAHHVLRQCTLFSRALRQLPRSSNDGTLGSRSRHRGTDVPRSPVGTLNELLRWGEFGVHLTQPWKVVLCGRPNVGKSSLINALVGYTRSIVFDQPGTTRDVVAVETSLDGWPVEFSDTAGLRETAAELESAGISRARERLSQADLIVIVLDASAGLTSEDARLLAEFPAGLAVWNKSDLVESAGESRVEFHPPEIHPVRGFSVSAAKPSGIEELIRRIVDRLVPEEPDAYTPFPVTEEQCRRLRHLLDLHLGGDGEGFDRNLAEWLAQENS